VGLNLASNDGGDKLRPGVRRECALGWAPPARPRESPVERKATRGFADLALSTPPTGGQYIRRGWVGQQHSLAVFRDEILGRLKTRGTELACQELRRVISEFPDQGWLEYSLLDVEATTRRQSWRPLTPRELSRVTAHSQARLVQSAHQLMEVLVESLRRLERPVKAKRQQLRTCGIRLRRAFIAQRMRSVSQTT
jgi:hypothetical protein